jgi:NAD dependent epimerase/dehydratase family enzyme
VLLGEGGTVVLDGQRVLPTRTQASGFAFAFPDIDSAVADVVKA